MRRRNGKPWGASVMKMGPRPKKPTPGQTVPVVEITFKPTKVTKGLKRQLLTQLRQNPVEAHRQMEILGVTEASLHRKAKH